MKYFGGSPQRSAAGIERTRQIRAPFKTYIIAGGGHVGKRLALALENDHQLKIIEKNQSAPIKSLMIFERLSYS